jgi:2-polyprenyl-6-methoxyphenol hydroxylase-like FAD-dependent oxidoreductase
VTEHYDAIIVGSGAGGGTLAHTLARSGKRILLLERGDFLTRETDNWDPGAVFVNPALTAMANAIRVGEHLLSRMS